MKNSIKRFVLFILLAITSINLSAQVFHEDFEVVDSVVSSGNPGWFQNTRISVGGLACDSSTVVAGGISYLESDLFSTLGLQNVFLSFYHICRIDFFDAARVEVSIDGGLTWIQQSPVYSSATWLDWDPANPGTVATNNMWKHDTINIGIAANKPNVKIRFALYDLANPGSGGYPGWFIDNVLVGEPSNVTGFVYNDLNSNCAFDGSDSLLPNTPIRLVPSALWWGNSVLTDATGNFNLPVFDLLSTHILYVDSNPNFINFSTVCPASYTINTFPSSGNSFGLTFSGTDLAIGYTPLPCIVGDTTFLNLCFQSLTPYPVSGEFQAVFSSLYIPLVSAAIPPVTQISGDTLIWDLSTLSPNGLNYCITLPIAVDTNAQITDTLSFWLNINSFNGDINSANNTYMASGPPCTSFDPNHKTVSPEGSIHAGDQLTYTVEFENIGTAPAQKVFVFDTLDSTKLDLSTLQIEFLSHIGSVTLNQNMLSVLFNNINLPPTSVNPNASTGHFTYSIYSKQNLVTGDLINNDAAIYFDFNAPIITNTTSTLIDNALFVTSTDFKNDVKVFPNPSHEKFFVHVDEIKKTTFALADITGKEVAFTQKQISNSVFELKVGKQAKGIFILKMMNDGEINFQKVVMN